MAPCVLVLLRFVLGAINAMLLWKSCAMHSLLLAVVKLTFQWSGYNFASLLDHLSHLGGWVSVCTLCVGMCMHFVCEDVCVFVCEDVCVCVFVCGGQEEGNMDFKSFLLDSFWCQENNVKGLCYYKWVYTGTCPLLHTCTCICVLHCMCRWWQRGLSDLESLRSFAL